MNVYLISADFDLIIKPQWLDDFRKLYDKPYPYHVTLKNTSYVKESDLPLLETTLPSITTKYPPIELTFKTYSFVTTDNGHVIMILAEQNDMLMTLQKEIRETFAPFGEHVRADFKAFETNFKPHMTIARELTEERLTEAKKKMSENILCTTVIK